MPERFRVPPFEKLVKFYRVLAAIAVLAVIYLACAKLIKNPIAKVDLEVYLHAAKLLLAGNNPYLTSIPAGVYYYLYPPLLAFLFIPFTFIPINAVVVLWCVLNVLLTGWIMKTFYELISGTPFFEVPAKTRWVICFFSLLPTARFIFNHLSYGQSNIAMLALALLGLVYWKKEKPVAGGAAIGLSIAIKVISLPLAVWFLARRNLRVTLGIVAGLIIGLLLPALLLGFGKNLEFLDYWVRNIVLYDDLRNTKWPLHVNLSLQAQLYRFFSDTAAFEFNGKLYSLTLFAVPVETLHLIGRLIVILIAGTPAWYAYKYRKHGALVLQWGGIALTFSLMPLFATVMQKHYLVLLLPAYLYVMHLWYDEKLEDKMFRSLVPASMALLTLSSAVFCGEFLSRLLAASGCLALGVLLLSAAIFRAAACLRPS
ncbi:MAG TPA: glycosyltransferase family 87 protein [Burkholderiales bacterium]|nr:glycosyltransferase family 87 protein [Burkholderiales bacterium]